VASQSKIKLSSKDHRNTIDCFMSHAPLANIIAHRGASADAPENTLSALRLAAQHNARCVEIDVSISSDGVPFVHHDHTLHRCTTGTGLLCEHTASQLDQLNAGSGMSGFENEPLPRLSTVLELLKEHSLGLNLEIKPYEGLEEQTVDAIQAQIESAWPSDLALVLSSFSHESIDLARQRMPEVARAPLVGAVPDDWPAVMQRYDAHNLHCAEDSLTQSQAQMITKAGYGLYCYTVNDTDKARTLLSWGVNGVFTDHPKTLLQVLET